LRQTVGARELSLIDFRDSKPVYHNCYQTPIGGEKDVSNVPRFKDICHYLIRSFRNRIEEG
jgi:hypothetical protein